MLYSAFKGPLKGSSVTLYFCGAVFVLPKCAVLYFYSFFLMSVHPSIRWCVCVWCIRPSNVYLHSWKGVCDTAKEWHIFQVLITSLFSFFVSQCDLEQRGSLAAPRGCAFNLTVPPRN